MVTFYLLGCPLWILSCHGFRLQRDQESRGLSQIPEDRSHLAMKEMGTYGNLFSFYSVLFHSYAFTWPDFQRPCELGEW